MDNEFLQAIKPYYNEYHIKVVDINSMKTSDMFQTDLREVLGFLMRQKDKKELKKYVKENKRFRHLREDAYEVIATLSSTKGLEIKKETSWMKGEIDMCQAIDEMLQDEREEGREEGRQEGINRVSFLFQKLIENQRFEDLERAAKEAEFRNQLLEEF